MGPPSILCLLVDVVDLAHEVRLSLNGHSKRTLGLTIEQALALCCLKQNGGEVTHVSLADCLRRTAHSTTSLVDKLQAKGLVRRERREHSDRRQVWIRLTEEGARTQELFMTSLEDFFHLSASEPQNQRIAEAVQALGFLKQFLEQ